MARRSEASLDGALELLHFGFRAIVRGPDRELERLGLSRVHHRMLYFIRRDAGISVGALLRTLGVTKQALHRPLAQLVAAQLVVRAPDPRNRRVVQLRLSRKGEALERKLSGAQREHFRRAFAEAGAPAERGWRTVMRALMAAVPGPDKRDLQWHISTRRTA